MTAISDSQYITMHTDYHLFFNLYEDNVEAWNLFRLEANQNISNVTVHDILQKIRFNLIPAVINLTIGIESYFEYWISILHPLKKIQIEFEESETIDISTNNVLTNCVDCLLKIDQMPCLINQLVMFIEKNTEKALVDSQNSIKKLEALVFLRNEVVHGSTYIVNNEIRNGTSRVFKNYGNDSPLKNFLEVTNNVYMLNKLKNVDTLNIQQEINKKDLHENDIKRELLDIVNESIVEFNNIKDVFTELRMALLSLARTHKINDIHNDCVLTLDSSSCQYKPIKIRGIRNNAEALGRKIYKNSIKKYFKEHANKHNLACGDDGEAKLDLKSLTLESIFNFTQTSNNDEL